MQVKIGIRFHGAEITYFEINRLYAYVKQIICKGIQFWYKLLYKIDFLTEIMLLELKYF